MYPEVIQRYSREKNLSLQDAAQTFLQVIVLKHLQIPEARFMGGTALVLGYGNPRFSEDIDLTQISDPQLLKPGLSRAAAELEGWFASPIRLTAPQGKGRTWRVLVRLSRSESLRLHVDSQGYPSETTHPIVIGFPFLPNFIVEAMGLNEIMAEKTVALAYRRYLGGRDLFDLWFHWLRNPEDPQRPILIRQFIEKKLRDRALSVPDFLHRLEERLHVSSTPKRAESEWKRYLPPDFQRPTVFEAILSSCCRLPEYFR